LIGGETVVLNAILIARARVFLNRLDEVSEFGSNWSNGAVV